MAALLSSRLRLAVPELSALFGQLRLTSSRPKLFARDDTNELVRRPIDPPLHKRPCPICSRKIEISYRDVKFLSQFVSKTSGSILRPSTTGVCAKQQRKLAKAIKQARNFGLMPCISRHSLLKDEELPQAE